MMFFDPGQFSQNFERVAGHIAGLWRPPDPMTVTQWAEAKRILSVENCALPGPYRVAVTPFLKEILDEIANPEVEKVVCQKSAQIAWTDGVVNNTIGYFIDHEPCPMLALFPTENMAKRFSKEKLDPMIRDCRDLNGKVAERKSRDSGNTILSKNFKGGHLELVGSNSPVNLSSSPIRVVIIEEPDRCAANSGGEGNSLKLAIERTKTYYNRKIILGGSPTIKGFSEVEREMKLSDQRRFNIPCHRCGEYHIPNWSMVVWDKDPNRKHDVFKQYVPESARFKCPICGGTYSNAEKNAALSAGIWIPSAPFNGIPGFYLSELYSPFPKSKISDVAAKFLEAKHYMDAGDPTLMITWINTSLGEPYEEKGDGCDDAALIARVESFGSQDVDAGVLCITAAVDVQNDRLEVEVVGWGAGDESWSLDWIRIEGDPETDKPWVELDKTIDRKFNRNGVDMRIACACVDSGAHTDAVYKYVRPRQIRRVFAVKGKSTEGDPVVGRPSKKSNLKGLKLYPIGTDTAKTVIMARLKLEKPGPGYCHFPADRDPEYFAQLTAEEMVTRYRNGRPYRFWKKTRARNEALDLRVYNLAALKILNPNYKKLKEKLDAKESRVQEKQAAPDSPQPEVKKASLAEIRRRAQTKRKNFVQNY